jgi:hypothetical protein
MDLHNFDGKNLSVWMFQLQQCFIYYKTPNDLHKYMFASYHMEGEALNWLVTMERGGVFTMDADWENFVRLIHLRFGQESEEQKCDTIDKLEEDFGEEIEEATKEQIQTTVIEENLENFKNAEEEKRDDPEARISVPENVEDLKQIKNGDEAQDMDPATDPQQLIDETDPNKETNLVEATYQLIDGIPQPRFSESVVVKQFQVRAENLEASIHFLSSFVSQYLKEDEVDVVSLKHRWRWKHVAEEESWVRMTALLSSEPSEAGDRLSERPKWGRCSRRPDPVFFFLLSNLHRGHTEKNEDRQRADSESQEMLKLKNGFQLVSDTVTCPPFDGVEVL